VRKLSGNYPDKLTISTNEDTCEDDFSTHSEGVEKPDRVECLGKIINLDPSAAFSFCRMHQTALQKRKNKQVSTP